MRIIIKHILRNIAHNRLKSVMVIIALALSTMVLFLNLTIRKDMTLKYEATLRGVYKDYDLKLSKKAGREDITFLQQELELDDLRITEQLYFQTVGGVLSEQNTQVNLLGTDISKLERDQLIQFEEKLPDFNQDSNDLVISHHSKETLGIDLGQSIKLLTTKGDIELRVGAIVKNGGILQTNSTGTFFLVSDDYVTSLQGEALHFAFFKVADGEDIHQVRRHFNDRHPEFQLDLLIDPNALEDAVGIVNQLLTLVLLVIILLNTYILSSLIERLLAERIPVMGTFRSVGASKRRVGLILLSENFIYGVLGGLCGVLLGGFLREPLASVFIESDPNATYAAPELTFQWDALILSISFSIFIQLLIAWKSIRKANKLSIKDTIFNTVHREMVYSKRSLLLGIILITLGSSLDLLNKHFELLRSIVSILLIIIGIVLVIPYLTKLCARLFESFFGHSFGAPARLGAKHLASSRSVSSNIRLVSISVGLMMMIYMVVLSLNHLFDVMNSEYDYDVLIRNIQKDENHYTALEKIEGIDDITFLTQKGRLLAIRLSVRLIQAYLRPLVIPSL